MTFKILLLHGFTQNASIIKQRFARTMSDIEKIITKKHEVEWIIPNGTYCLNNRDDGINNQGEKIPNTMADTQLAWYYYDKQNPLNFKEYIDRKDAECYGFEESLTQLSAYKNADIDLIIGFSQGAQMAYRLIVSKIIIPKQVIFISGFISHGLNLVKHLDDHTDRLDNLDDSKSFNKINIKSLHVWGTNDNIICNDKSIELCDQFLKSDCLIHNKHHIISFNKSISDSIAAWVSGNID